ncbi:hypothetical protein [Spirosoma rigui]|uniref:hypothetical protein n=1 Tax=Spirosoma rigui TaxID=564064 RepID=UPI0009B079BB|nr:hypothetical protein [Spirosoma rigui]
MENYQPTPSWADTQTPLLKESIRDMIRLQIRYQIPDELFWEIFNARVLQNEQIDVDAFFDTRTDLKGRA